ncbi:MAG TPA: cupin domain-containing protein [Noviherbaspirillum sp.]|nr:cupin domain-containing protein [Noviherbaspirillum sp.]
MATRKVPNQASHILRESDLEWAEHQHGIKIGARTAAIANRIGSEKLGFRLVELAPGKAAYPVHFHLANEEMFYILHGRGTIRLGESEIAISQGDFVSIPASDASLAHQIVNTSSSALRYLAVSTMNEPDVVLYPDSAKIAVYAGTAPGGKQKDRTLEYVALWNKTISYWMNEN